MTKTLVCIIAETRGNKITWPSFKHYVLDTLRADLLLCISVSEKYDFMNPLWQFAKYRYSVPDFEDWGEAFDEAQKSELKKLGDLDFPDWRELLNIKDQWLGGVKGPGQHPGSAGILIYFRWLLLDFLRSEGLINRYDRFVLTRSDFVWETPHPPMDLLSPEFIWIPDGEGHSGLTDRHAVLSKQNVVTYLNIIKSIVTEPKALFSEMENKKNWNLEQFIDYSLVRSGISDKVRYFPYVMYSTRERGGSTRWSEGDWNKELGYYVKYANEFASARAAKSVIKGTTDWEQIFTENADIAFNARVLTSDSKVVALIDGRISRVAAEGLANFDYYIFSIDYSHGEGRLFIARSSFGNNKREKIDDIELIKIGQNSFYIKSKIGGLLYSITDAGLLKKHKDSPTSFKFQSRYFVQAQEFLCGRKETVGAECWNLYWSSDGELRPVLPFGHRNPILQIIIPYIRTITPKPLYSLARKIYHTVGPIKPIE
jgi:hypothetical protein